MVNLLGQNFDAKDWSLFFSSQPYYHSRVLRMSINSYSVNIIGTESLVNKAVFSKLLTKWEFKRPLN